MISGGLMIALGVALCTALVWWVGQERDERQGRRRVRVEVDRAPVRRRRRR